MAVTTSANFNQPSTVLETMRPSRTMSAMTRGVLFTLGGHVASLARPIAIAWFAHIYDAASLGSFILIWTCIELGARFATLGLDRGVQRWADDRRALATVAAMTVAGLTALATAVALAFTITQLVVIDADAFPIARGLLVVALPLTAMGNIALRAARGSTQIATYVLARSVTEPLLLLVAGLVLSPLRNGLVVLFASLAISVAGGAVVASAGLVRTFGFRNLVGPLTDVRAWPARELLRISFPLGLADLLQGAQAKLDLLAVAIMTVSASAITSYAIAAEIAGVFVAIRIGFDQIIMPLAADAHGNRTQLAHLLATAMRWSATIVGLIAFVILAFPARLLHWFGGSGGAVLVLLVLAVGRAVEAALAPASSMLTIIGEPKLPLLDAAAAVSIALLGQFVAGILGAGPVAIAVASAMGVIASSVLGVFWLANLGISRCSVEQRVTD